jgi:PKD repeat protein
MRRGRAPGLVVLASAILAAAACDKVALTAPTDTTITLFASANTVPLGGSMEVTASVIEPAGTAVQNGTLVTFTSSIGSIDPREARTKDGKATVRFIAGNTSGTATISAFSGSARATADLELKVGGSAASRIVVSASPNAVPSGGGSVQVIATVFDADGNRVPGVPVSFSTDAGSLAQAVVVSDTNGEARVALTTTREATVTVNAGAASAATVRVIVNAAPTVNISVTTANPTANQQVVFSVSAGAGTNGAPVRDVVIDFGDGDRLSLGTIGSGAVSVPHIYDEPGTYRVTVTATDASGERTSMNTIVIVAPPVPLTLAFQAFDPTPVVGAVTTVRVQVTPTTAQIARYEYDFGDGTSAVLNTNSTTHVYTTPGPKTIRVTAVTVDGQRGTIEGQINVQSSSGF